MAKLSDRNKVFKLLTLSKAFMEEHTSCFIENERLKEGRPKDGIPPQYPRVTDKTLSKKINDTPKRIFQKIPEFTIDTGATEFEDVCAEFILMEEFINGADDGYSWYQKLINSGRDAAGFGACAMYSPFERSGGSYRVGFIPIYWSDYFPEAYCTNFNTANHSFIKQWKTEVDMQKIVDVEDTEIDDGWNRTEVRELIKNHATTPKDKQKICGSDDLYEVYTYLSEDEFITVSIANGEKILCYRENKSKRRRILGFYYDFDGTNPMGRSMVDIAGDLQNLIDSDMQAYQFNRALSLQPPIFVSGDIDSGDGIFMPNNVIVVDDPATAAKALEVNTAGITEYPNLYALQISQMNALIPDAGNTSISAEATGGLRSSKTATGIKQNQVTESISDNFFFKNAEAFLSNWAENALNIYFGEFDGVIELQLSNDYAQKAKALDPTKVSPTGVVRLDCSAITKVRVKVDSGSTRDVAREEDNARLAGIINMEGQSPVVAATIGAAGTKELVKSMIKSSGVSNAGDIMEAIDSAPEVDPNSIGPDGLPIPPEEAEAPGPDPGLLNQAAQLDVSSKQQDMMLKEQKQKMDMAKTMHDMKLKEKKANAPATKSR